MRDRALKLLTQAVNKCLADAQISGVTVDHRLIHLETPKRAEHGDFSTNVAMRLSKQLRRNPRDIASQIIDNLEDEAQLFQNIAIAGPGFINFTISPRWWFQGLAEIEQKGSQYGYSGLGNGRKILVEYVSANPTGPLHVGHGRGAVFGDVLSNILKATGHDVSREYYINDSGNQIRILGQSLCHRVLQQRGITDLELPEHCYPGEYLVEIAEEFIKIHGDAFDGEDPESPSELFVEFAMERLLQTIRADLDTLGIRFDTWFSERTLYQGDALEQILAQFRAKDLIYDEENKQKFKSSQFGDDDDRVVVRDTGQPTYFASDIIYHANKFSRGFDTLINIWGADHHGYIPRLKAIISALGKDPADLELKLVQFVNLVRAGQPVRMGKRSGEFVTLREVIAEVGADAARVFFIMRSADSMLDFDLQLATQQDKDNPVYYLQYGYARICQIMKFAQTKGLVPDSYRQGLHEILVLPEELLLAKTIQNFTYILQSCALTREVHHVVFYMKDLLKIFHTYYTRYKDTEKVVGDDVEKSRARLFLMRCIQTVIKNGLDILDVSAPQRM